MEIISKIEKNYRRDKEISFAVFELIPGVAFRYVSGGFGREANMYVSWLFWTVSITLSFKNKDNYGC